MQLDSAIERRGGYMIEFMLVTQQVDFKAFQTPPVYQQQASSCLSSTSAATSAKPGLV